MNSTREEINEALAKFLSEEEIEAWWDEQWPCTCSTSHGSRREFFELNPDAVKTDAFFEYRLLKWAEEGRIE